MPRIPSVLNQNKWLALVASLHTIVAGAEVDEYWYQESFATDHIIIARNKNKLWSFFIFQPLTHKQLETRCIISTVATDALVLMHQAISIHGADKILFMSD